MEQTPIEAIMAARAAGNAFLLHSTLFPFLEEDSFNMAHMDPSDIIDAPFPLYQLCTFVAFSLVWNLLVALVCRMVLSNESQTNTDGHQSGALHIGLIIGISTVIIHSICILCGIHPTMLPRHTLVSAFYLAFNILLPVLLFLPVNYAPQQQHHPFHNSIIKEVILKLIEVCNHVFGPMSSKRQQKKQHKLSNQQQNQYRIQYIHQYTTLGTIIGVVACAILRILDHGLQIQRYPIPIITGATWGSCGGVLIGTMLAAFSSY